MVGPVIFDTIKRYLVYSGYEVTWVVNITDVDDKLINKSREKGISMFQLATQMTADYLSNLHHLGSIRSIIYLEPPTIWMRSFVSFRS